MQNFVGKKEHVLRNLPKPIITISWNGMMAQRPAVLPADVYMGSAPHRQAVH